LWWTKWRCGRFSPSTSVSPANLYSTDFSTITITYHLWLVQYANSGRSTKRLSFTPLRVVKNNNNNNKPSQDEEGNAIFCCIFHAKKFGISLFQPRL
jgi:hypothetical protein